MQNVGDDVTDDTKGPGKRRSAVRADRREGRKDRRAERRSRRHDRRDDRRDARRDHRDERRERRRRSPEVARQELVDAAERVFAEHAPEEVGLKEIAREAGVSHALITHYFGTYAGLIEATLQRRLIALRETMVVRLREAGVLARPEELLAILFGTFDDPVHLRLMKWMVSHERTDAIHALALRHQGLQIVAQQVAHALMAQPTRECVEQVELTLMTAVAAALGYAIGKHALAGAAARDVSATLDDAVRTTLAGMVRAYLTTQLGTAAPAAAAPVTPE